MSESIAPPIDLEKAKELLQDGFERRFLFIPNGRMLIQQIPFVDFPTHYELGMEYCFCSPNLVGGYLKVENGQFILCEKKSITLPKPTQQLFENALKKGIVFV